MEEEEEERAPALLQTETTAATLEDLEEMEELELQEPTGEEEVTPVPTPALLGGLMEEEEEEDLVPMEQAQELLGQGVK